MDQDHDDFAVATCSCGHLLQRHLLPEQSLKFFVPSLCDTALTRNSLASSRGKHVPLPGTANPAQTPSSTVPPPSLSTYTSHNRMQINGVNWDETCGLFQPPLFVLRHSLLQVACQFCDSVRALQLRPASPHGAIQKRSAPLLA